MLVFGDILFDLRLLATYSMFRCVPRMILYTNVCVDCYSSNNSKVSVVKLKTIYFYSKSMMYMMLWCSSSRISHKRMFYFNSKLHSVSILIVFWKLKYLYLCFTMKV